MVPTKLHALLLNYKMHALRWATCSKTAAALWYAVLLASTEKQAPGLVKNATLPARSALVRMAPSVWLVLKAHSSIKQLLLLQPASLSQARSLLLSSLLLPPLLLKMKTAPSKGPSRT